MSSPANAWRSRGRLDPLGALARDAHPLDLGARRTAIPSLAQRPEFVSRAILAWLADQELTPFEARIALDDASVH